MAVSARVVRQKGEAPRKRFGKPQLIGLIVQAVLVMLAVGLGSAGELVVFWWGAVAGSLAILAIGYEAAFGTGEDDSYLVWFAGLGGVAAGFVTTLLALALLVMQMVNPPAAAAEENGAAVSQPASEEGDGAASADSGKQAPGGVQPKKRVLSGTRSRLGRDVWENELEVAEEGSRKPDELLLLSAVSTGAIGVVFILGIIRRTYPWNFWTTFLVSGLGAVPGGILGFVLKMIVS